jgi:hypothetical protein
LDGAYHEDGETLAWDELGHLKTGEVGAVLEDAVRRMDRYLRRHGLIDLGGRDIDGEVNPETALDASAVSGHEPPAGPQWLRGLSPLSPRALAFDKPLCASLDGFTLHAATRAGALDLKGREALLRYVLRPPLAQDRVELRPEGLVRISLKRPFADGTVAVDMDPLSLLCRLAASVPPPRFHTVKYAGALASASPWRSRIGPRPDAGAAGAEPRGDEPPPSTKKNRGGYRPWAELLQRTYLADVLACPCGARRTIIADISDPPVVAAILAHLGMPTVPPPIARARDPSFEAA